MNPNQKHRILAFKDWVPHPLRFIIFTLSLMVFQFCNPVYMPLVGDVIGATQLTREEAMVVFQTNMVGMALVFPLLFRVKFRFTSQQIIIFCSLAVALLLWICTRTESMVILIVAAFFMGIFKMFGMFEGLSSIQLVITPTRDFGLFFSFAMPLILACGQVSGILAVYLSEFYDWKTMHYFMIMVLLIQAIIGLTMLRPIRFVKKLPLYNIDYLGMLNWAVVLFLINYIATCGEREDWFESKKITVAVIALIVFSALTYFRTVSKKRAYVLPAAFKYKYVNVAFLMFVIAQIFLNTNGSVLSPFTAAILKLDDLHSVSLNWWIVSGFAVGGIFCYMWFYKINGPFKILFAIGFSCLTIYHAMLFFSFSSYSDEKVMYLPYFLRGVGNIVIFVGAAKYMLKNLGFEMLAQALFVVGIVRNAVVGNVVAGIVGHWEHHLVNDYIVKLSSHMDRISSGGGLFNLVQMSSEAKGASTLQAAQSASSAMYGKVYLQSLMLSGKDIFGWITIFGIVVIFAILFSHFSEPFIRKIPTWGALLKKIKQKA